MPRKGYRQTKEHRQALKIPHNVKNIIHENEQMKNG